MKVLNYYDVKEYLTKEDEIACNEAWDAEIELHVDEIGRVWNEGGQYIADVVVLEENKDY